MMDACHNQEGAKALKKQLEKLPANKKLLVWFGSMGEDRATEILQVLCEFAAEIRFFQPGQPRACSFEVLQHLVPEKYSGNLQLGEIKNVVPYLDQINSNQILLITGSIYLLGEIMEIVKSKKYSLGTTFQDLI